MCNIFSFKYIIEQNLRLDILKIDKSYDHIFFDSYALIIILCDGDFLFCIVLSVRGR